MGKFHVSQVDKEGYPRRDGIFKTIWDVTLIGALFILTSMTLSNRTPAPEDDFSEKLTNTEKVVNRRDEFMGQTVTLKTNNIQTVGKSAFTVNGERRASKQPVLVINASGDQFQLPRDGNTRIQVTGQMRNLSVPILEQEYGLNLQDPAYQKFNNQPVIVAQHIAIAPQPSQVTARPQNFYGKTVAVVGEVDNLQNPMVFNLQEPTIRGEKTLPVILTKAPKIAVNPGQTVEVIGEVRPFVANQIQQEYNPNWDEKTKQQLASAYGNTPVIVAEEVYR